MKKRLLCVLIGVVGLTNFSLPTRAEERRQSAVGHPVNVDVTGEITEQKAIAIAKQHFKGRILAIQLSDHTFRIKILNAQGTLHTVLIDATTGGILSNH